MPCVGLWCGLIARGTFFGGLAICTFLHVHGTNHLAEGDLNTGKPPRRSLESLARTSNPEDRGATDVPTLTASCHVALASRLLPPES